MTVNDLEQAIRNLIASQPMITSGSSGEVINSVLSIIYSFKELNFKVQAHPFQDALKMNMFGELQKVENDLVISVCQLMQERGINLMLYAQMNQFPTPMMQPQTPQPPQYPKPPMAGPQAAMVGQMAYSAPQMNAYGPAPMPQYAQPMPNPSVPPQPQRAPGGVQPMSPPPAPRRRSTAAPTIQRPTPPPAPAVGTAPEQASPVAPNPGAESAPRSAKKGVVDSLVGEFQGDDAPSGKAAGRDYLLELLKK